MTWYLCTVSKNEPENWAKAKSVGLWGVPGGSRVALNVKKGDHLLFWLGRRGYVAFGVVADEARVPLRKEEVPWPGGLARWRYVIPIRVQIEIQEPIRLKFARAVQEQTGFTAMRFQRGFAAIDDGPAKMIAEKIVERSLSEHAASET